MSRRWRWKGARASARFNARMMMRFELLVDGSGARVVKRRERPAPPRLGNGMAATRQSAAVWDLVSGGLPTRRYGAGKTGVLLCVSASGNSQLAGDEFLWIVRAMSAQEVIEEFKALPPAERAQVTKFVVENDDSWIPDEFKEAMKDAEAGRFVDMETALFETPPPRLR